ncbi:MAG: hypothetical protein KDD61_03920 [Bdellovibrionales bacterium]|nr:hypothetical protein [Bdellovibrionales bacterium]
MTAIILSSTLFSAEGQSKIDKLEPSPIIETYFDAANKTLFVKVEYRNGCIEPFTELYGVQGNTLIVTHIVKVNPGYCIQVIDYNWIEFDVSEVPAGTYNLIGMDNQKSLGQIHIP